MNVKFLNAPLTTETQAKAWIEELVVQDKMFHFDDDPRTIIDVKTSERTFTDEEADSLTKRVNELYNFDWGEYECPIGYALHIMEDVD